MPKEVKIWGVQGLKEQYIELTGEYKVPVKGTIEFGCKLEEAAKHNSQVGYLYTEEEHDAVVNGGQVDQNRAMALKLLDVMVEQLRQDVKLLIKENNAEENGSFGDEEQGLEASKSDSEAEGIN